MFLESTFFVVSFDTCVKTKWINACYANNDVTKISKRCLMNTKKSRCFKLLFLFECSDLFIHVANLFIVRMLSFIFFDSRQRSYST